MPVTDDQIKLLRKQQALVEQLKAVLATQQRTLATLGASDDLVGASVPRLEHADSENDDETQSAIRDAVDAESGPALVVPPWVATSSKPPEGASDEAPKGSLRLDRAIGYRARGCRANIAFVDSNKIVYPVESLAVVYDTATAQQTFYQGHHDSVLCLDYNPTKRLVATGQRGRNGSIHIWSVDEPAGSVALLEGHTRGVGAVAFSPDGARVASVGLDDARRILVHDVATKTIVCEIKGAAEHIYSIRWNRTAAADASREFVTVGRDHIAFWALDTSGAATRTDALFGPRCRRQNFLDVAFTPEHTLVATECGDVYVLSDHRAREVIHAHNGAVFAVCTERTSDVFFTGGRDGFVNAWDRASFKNVGTLCINAVESYASGASIKALHLLPGATKAESRLLIGSDTGSIWEANPAAGQSSLTRRVAGQRFGDVFAVVTHPTDSSIVATCGDAGVHVWNLKNASVTVFAAIQGARCLAYTADGRHIAVGSRSGAVVVLSAADLSEVAKIRAQPAAVTCLAFAADGSVLAAGYESHGVEIRRWGKDADLKLVHHAADVGGITGMDFASNGASLRVATSAGDVITLAITGERIDAPNDDDDFATLTLPQASTLQGVWPNGSARVEDIATVERSHGRQLCVTATTAGLVRLMRYPAVGSGLDAAGVLTRAPSALTGRGHSRSIGAAFTADDATIVSAGDGAMLVWRIEA
jgi:microtubule-associated protein-like 6